MTTVKSGRSALIILACGLTIAAAAGCARTSQGGPEHPTAVGGLGAAGTPSVAPKDPAGGQTDGGGQPQGGGTPTGQPKPSSHTTSSAPPVGPQIVYFRVKQQPQCPRGTNQFPIPGVPAIVEWKVTGADQVALSVDNPNMVGSYGTYGVQANETLGFGCSGAPGTMAKHTYTIYTVGGGTQRSRTLTVEAKVYEIAQV